MTQEGEAGRGVVGDSTQPLVGVLGGLLHRVGTQVEERPAARDEQGRCGAMKLLVARLRSDG